MSAAGALERAEPAAVPPPGLVLASASRARRRLLEQAGVAAAAEPANVDEAEVKAALRAEGASAAQAAETLAELKARRVAARYPGTLVLGADQILECDGVWYDKPADRAEAAAQLRALAGRRHALETAVCAVRDGTRLWHHRALAHLVMRPLAEPFIERYLDAAGATALASVGAYQLEGLGAQLFARVEGDYFAILGLPLLPLLEFLREQGAIGR